MCRSASRPFLIASTFVQTSIFLGIATTTMASCRARPAHELRVHVINEAGAASESIEAAAVEASEIWEHAGLRLTWTFSPESPLPGGHSVIVVVRRDLKRAASATAVSADGRVRPPLGWLVFDEQGRSGRLIEISFAMTSALVERGAKIDRPIATLPELGRQLLLGRGLGRVIAHEIGHWLMGRGHVDSGLMKPRFNAVDLVDVRSPHLPKAWLEASLDPRAMPAACVPVALQRFVAN